MKKRRQAELLEIINNNDVETQEELQLRLKNSGFDFMDGNDYDEELKIDIANAMSNGELGIDGEDYNTED